MNATANLVTLCDFHHDEVHRNNEKYVYRHIGTGRRLILVEDKNFIEDENTGRMKCKSCSKIVMRKYMKRHLKSTQHSTKKKISIVL